MKKKLAMLLAAIMLVMLFTGCGAGGKEDKGELNLYTWDGMFPQEILDGFEKETGIRIHYSNFDYDEDMLYHRAGDSGRFGAEAGYFQDQHLR